MKTYRAWIGIAVAVVLLSVASGRGEWPWPPGTKHLRYKVCTVSDVGFARCLTSRRLAEIFAEQVAPDTITRLMGLVEDFAKDHGVDSSGDFLAECHGEWRGINVATAVGAKRGATTRRPLRATTASGAALSHLDQRALLASCASRVSPVRTGGAPGIDEGRQQMVDSTVEKVDDGFSRCRDSTTGPVSQTGEFEKWYLRNYGVPLENGKNWDDSAHSTNDIAGRLVAYKLLIELGEWAKENKEKSDQEYIDHAIKENEAKKQTTPAAGPTAAAAPTAVPPPEPTAIPKEEEEAQQCLEDAKCEEPAPTASYPSPDGTATSCAEKQARWNRFKEYCEMSNWREFRCEQFLRVVNGCADITRINPGPDGDATCNAPQSEKEKREAARKRDCERRGMISIPNESGKQTCLASLTAPGMPVKDICNDPRAHPGPDQCLGGGTPDGGGHGPIGPGGSSPVAPAPAPGGPSPNDQRGGDVPR